MLKRLIQKRIHGSLDAAGMAQLEDILRNDKAARTWYLEEMQLHSALHRWAMRQTHRTIPLPHGNESSNAITHVEDWLQKQKKQHVLLAMVASLVIVVGGLSLMRAFLVEETTAPQHAFRTSSGTRYQLSHPDGSDHQAGHLVHGSQLSLSQGSVELSMGSGVRAVILAPAEIVLQNENTVSMPEGIAWFHVPKAAKGFTVHTKEFQVVDLGTEFGISSGKNRHDEVHVIKGQVRVHSKGLRKITEHLSANQARRTDPVGRLKQITPRFSTFERELPRTLPHLHWSFDHQVAGGFPAEGIMMDLDLATARTRNPSTKQPTTEGSFGQAVRLNHYKNELITSHPGISGSESRTIAAWIKIEAKHTPSRGRRTILGWGNRTLDKNSKKRWQLCITDNNQGGTNHLALTGAGFYRGNTPLDTDQWYHVACVWESKAGNTTENHPQLYINGELEQTNIPATQGPPDTDIGGQSSPVVIGSRLHLDATNPDSFFGCLDEVYLIKGALNQQEIQSLMLYNKF